MECLIKSDPDPEESEAIRISGRTQRPHLRCEARGEVVNYQVRESVDESELNAPEEESRGVDCDVEEQRLVRSALTQSHVAVLTNEVREEVLPHQYE